MQSHTDIHTHPHTYTPMQWSDSVICSVGEGSDITWWPRVPVLLMISNDHWHYTQKQSWPRLTLSYSHSHPVKETWTLLSQDINGYSCFITHSPIHSVSKNGGSTHVYLFKFASKYLSIGVWHDYVHKKSLSGQIWAKLCLTNYAEIHLDYACLSLNNIIH